MPSIEGSIEVTASDKYIVAEGETVNFNFTLRNMTTASLNTDWSVRLKDPDQNITVLMSGSDTIGSGSKIKYVNQMTDIAESDIPGVYGLILRWTSDGSPQSENDKFSKQYILNYHDDSFETNITSCGGQNLCWFATKFTPAGYTASLDSIEFIQTGSGGTDIDGYYYLDPDGAGNGPTGSATMFVSGSGGSEGVHSASLGGLEIVSGDVYIALEENDGHIALALDQTDQDDSELVARHWASVNSGQTWDTLKNQTGGEPSLYGQYGINLRYWILLTE